MTTRSGYTAENDRRLSEYLRGLPESDLEQLRLQVLHNLNVNEDTRAALIHQASMIRREMLARNKAESLTSASELKGGDQ